METAKLFMNGQSQSVRLPKDYRFTGDEVAIKKIGDVVFLFPKERAWETFIEGLNSFSDDFLEDRREQSAQAPRESL